MECADVRYRLVRYLDNDLPASVHGAVEAHLEHCYLCQEEMNELVSILDTCRDALRHPDPQPRFEALRPSLKREHAVPEAPGYRPVHVFRKVATAALAAAGIILMVSVGLSVVHTARVLVVLAETEAGQDTEFASTQPDQERPNAVTNPNPSRSGLLLPLLLAWQTEIQHAEKQTFQLGAANGPGEAKPEAQAAPEKGPDAYPPVSRGDSDPIPTKDARVVTGDEPSRVGSSEKRAVMA